MTKALLVTALAFSGAFQTASTPSADPRREPGTAIKEAIRLLEARDYAVVVKTFIRPSELEEMLTKHGTIEEVAKEFVKDDRPAKMLDVLKAASTMTPTMNADGTRANYTFEKPVGGAKRLSMAKIGDYWFLRD
jgi:hypothetical protein